MLAVRSPSLLLLLSVSFLPACSNTAVSSQPDGARGKSDDAECAGAHVAEDGACRADDGTFAAASCCAASPALDCAAFADMARDVCAPDDDAAASWPDCFAVVGM